MSELLAPAGNMEALKAAVSNGCNAVYLGMQKFGARAYSSNFDDENIKEAVDYAHLRDVKVYVTMNTIVFENEISDMEKQIDYLNEVGVDGIIVQDLAVLKYVKDNFKDLEAHCSTQMGIDDLEGTLLCKDLGADRVVMAREVEIDKVKEIRKKAGLPIEVFVHGALCVSYSGNCLMSGLIGYRSGNRGRCVGSCRKPYELIDKSNGSSYGTKYFLSTKDLKTIENIKALKGIDSLKIEGRMKEPVYVANVVNKYREALDGKSSIKSEDDLKKTFNRTYTKGYIFGEDKKDISNISRPNNFGYEIGKITGYVKGKYEISLSEKLNQNDIIRIDHGSEDVNLSVVKLYDKEGMLINSADDKCYIKLKERLSTGDTVYKTKEFSYYRKLEEMLDYEFKKFPLDLNIYAYPGAKLAIDAKGLGFSYFYESEETLEEAKTNPTTKEQVLSKLSKLNDTIFELNHVEYESLNVFIPVKLLNSARRQIVEKLYELKISSKNTRRKEKEEKEKISFDISGPEITCSVYTKQQYEVCKRLGIKEIYFDNTVRRNLCEYGKRKGELLLGGYGGIYYYMNKNPFVTDYSLNVVNSKACYELFRLGAKRVTLSYELNRKQIKDLIESYYRENDGYPSLEMIVYGRAPLMFTKYCPLKKMNLCGKCRENSYELRDEYGSFPVITHEDCNVTILNGKTLNLLDEMGNIEGIERFRLNFTTEDENEVEEIVKLAIGKLDGSIKESVFDKEKDTRGHFNKEII